MSSRDGFARADVDTNLMHDPKVLALARRLGDHTRTAAALVLYTSTVLASWKARARLTIAESVRRLTRRQRPPGSAGSSTTQARPRTLNRPRKRATMLPQCSRIAWAMPGLPACRPA